jgi:enolase-phosphatase E1
MRASAILCDIEGTTTSLSFVHDVLFPISFEEMGKFVQNNWKSPEIQALRSQISPFMAENVTAALRKWIESDQKVTELKAIQGQIWVQAYESGQIRSHVYPDVPRYFQIWKNSGKKIAIFSSGSIQAQKLLFRYSERGDLTVLIADYFDTTIGSKKEASSYRTIAGKLGLNPAQVLFLSDTVAELDAARESGFQTTQLIRDDAPPASHPVAHSFAEIPIE